MWIKVEGTSPKHVLKKPKIVPKSEPKANIARISVENVCSWSGTGGRNPNRGCLGVSPCSQPGCPPYALPPCRGGGLSQPESQDWVAGWAAGPPRRQQSLCRGLPCPSSDSSWQLWRNVLLTAVLLINGEHVCVAETFLVFFLILLFGGNTVKLFISTMKGVGVYYLPIPKATFTSDQPILETGTSLIPGCLFLNAFTHLHPSVLHSCHTIILS